MSFPFCTAGPASVSQNCGGHFGANKTKRVQRNFVCATDSFCLLCVCARACVRACVCVCVCVCVCLTKAPPTQALHKLQVQASPLLHFALCLLVGPPWKAKGWCSTIRCCCSELPQGQVQNPDNVCVSPKASHWRCYTHHPEGRENASSAAPEQSRVSRKLPSTLTASYIANSSRIGHQLKSNEMQSSPHTHVHTHARKHARTQHRAAQGASSNANPQESQVQTLRKQVAQGNAQAASFGGWGLGAHSQRFGMLLGISHSYVKHTKNHRLTSDRHHLPRDVQSCITARIGSTRDHHHPESFDLRVPT